MQETHANQEFEKSLERFEEEKLNKCKDIANAKHTGTKEHAPRAEHNNRTIKERICATYYQLPHDHLPKILVEFMVIECSKKLNFFPSRHGALKYYNPRIIVMRENIDFEKHCSFALGEYAQAMNEPDHTNTNAPRALDSLFLRVRESSGHDSPHLHANKIINQPKIWSAPITAAAINQAHKLAKLDRMPRGLKITNKIGLASHDSSWTA